MTFVSSANAERLFQLSNGLVLRGTKIEIPSLKEGFGAAAANNNALRPIWLIDDGLRRHYIHGRTMVIGDPVDVADPGAVIRFWQPVPTGGSTIGGLGTISGISPFNDYGRRQLSIRGPKGSTFQMIQGMSEINPRYAKLEALKNKPSYKFDMRVATSSIDSATLNRIFRRRVDQQDLNSRLELVRFFKDAERFGDARQALQATIDDFPDERDLEPLLISLATAQAEQLLDEANVRIKAGQRQLARSILEKFPRQVVGQVMRIRVDEAIAGLDREIDQSRSMVSQLRTQVQSLERLDEDSRAAINSIIDDMQQNLSADTLPRLSDYERLGSDENIPVENRVALAVSGWILGAGSGQQNLAIAESLGVVRDLVRQYGGSDDPAARQDILSQIRKQEAGTLAFIDAMAPLMTPVREFSDAAADDKVPGLFHVDVETIATPSLVMGDAVQRPDGEVDAQTGAVTSDPIDYHIQLPPEYDPHRSYPCIVALPNGKTVALAEIEWWCGTSMIANDDDPNSSAKSTQLTGARLGHASRNGYVVIAVRWARGNQSRYEYTPLEHHRVMASLRHAMRRVSIDSDRVFLTGHGEGGTAAWDIAVSHPDIWAGLIAVSAEPDKSILHYETNARALPKYLVMGEADGDRADGGVLDSYMSPRHDALIVMYRGRGRENFYDEVPRMMQWMESSANVREPIPVDIEVATIRPGDRRFWWLELLQINPA